jgi:hypothetical protein
MVSAELSRFCLCLPSTFRDTLLTRKYHPSQGGAIWEPESFYDESDARGLLIYHDAQFLNGGLEPYGTAGPGVRGTASERDELEYQLARLSHHPSIASEFAPIPCTAAADTFAARLGYPTSSNSNVRC